MRPTQTSDAVAVVVQPRTAQLFDRPTHSSPAGRPTGKGRRRRAAAEQRRIEQQRWGEQLGWVPISSSSSSSQLAFEDDCHDERDSSSHRCSPRLNGNRINSSSSSGSSTSSSSSRQLQGPSCSEPVQGRVRDERASPDGEGEQADAGEEEEEVGEEDFSGVVGRLAMSPHQQQQEQQRRPQASVFIPEADVGRSLSYDAPKAPRSRRQQRRASRRAMAAAAAAASGGRDEIREYLEWEEEYAHSYSAGGRLRGGGGGRGAGGRGGSVAFAEDEDLEMALALSLSLSDTSSPLAVSASSSFVSSLPTASLPVSAMTAASGAAASTAASTAAAARAALRASAGDLSYENLVGLEDVRCTLSSAALSRLPVVAVGAGGGGGAGSSHGAGLLGVASCSASEELLCPICLGELVEGDTALVLPCSHAFHHACGAEWLTAYSKHCPVCKQDADCVQEQPNTS